MLNYDFPRVRKDCHFKSCIQEQDKMPFSLRAVERFLFVLVAPLAVIIAWSVVVNCNCFGEDRSAELRAPISGGDFGLYLPATVCDTNTLLLLDTGSSISFLHRRFTPCLGSAIRKVNAQTADGSAELRIYNQPAMKIGPFLAKADDVTATLDLTKHIEVLDKEIGGLVGMAFLRDYSIELSFDNGYIKLTRIDPNFSLYSTNVSLYYVEGGTIAVKCDLPTGVSTFEIDTGDLSTGSLNDETFSSLMKSGDLKLEAANRNLNATTVKSVERGRLSKLKLGPYIIRDLVFSRGNANRLGLGYLRRFESVLDIKNARMYLKPSKSIDNPDFLDRSGLTIARRNREIVVVSIDKGSPAEKGGLTVDDVLVKINGRLGIDVGLYEIRQEFRNPKDKSYRLVVRQRGLGELIEKTISF